MTIIDKIKNKLYLDWNPWFRENIINPYHRRILKRHNVSILCNNCVGAVITHDLNLQFLSPFVNLWLYPKDFIRFCERIDYYTNCELQFALPVQKKYNYPVATLDDITIYFQHYHSEEEARDSWERRKKRINPNNIRCLLIERDGCTKDDLVRFSKLTYPTASLVHHPMPEIKNSHYIRGFEQEKEVGNSIEYKRGQCFGRRYYDDFNYVGFINDNK